MVPTILISTGTYYQYISLPAPLLPLTRIAIGWLGKRNAYHYPIPVICNCSRPISTDNWQIQLVGLYQLIRVLYQYLTALASILVF